MTGLHRRSLAAVLGFPWTISGQAQAVAAPTVAAPGPTDRLWRCLRLLEKCQREIDVQVDDSPHLDRLIENLDALLGQAAMIRPDTVEAYAVKARIVQLYGEDGHAGAMVGRFLLYDLMACGGMA